MMHFRTRLSLAAFLALAAVTPPALAQPEPTSPQELGRAIDEHLKQPLYENAIWAAIVIDLASGETLYQRHPRISLMPASNAKLFTTAAVLEQLGPDFTYTTDVFTDGTIEAGVITGNLIVRGSGDPVIGGRFNKGDMTEVFRNWAEMLRQQGIHTIQGDVIGDDDIFDDTPFGPGWSWDDEPFDYGAEISGLSFNDNTVSVIMTGRAAGRPAEIRWEPFNTPYVDIHNAAVIVPADARKDEEIERPRATNAIRIATELPAGRIDTTALAVTNPTLYFVHVLRDVLRANRIDVRGEILDVDDLSLKPNYASASRLFSHTSPPLARIVEVINKESQNLYAEQVLRTLGVVRPQPDPDLDPASTEMGIEAARYTYARAGVDTSRIQLVDGSGLSRMNLVTAEMTASLLRYMWRHPDAAVRQAFLASLPVAGVDGTLERRLRTGPALRNVRAKTGTLTGASALSGYVTSAAGTPLLFVLMSNNHTVRAGAVQRTQDAVVQLLARYNR
ncbi:MAG: D-alanyl-D-alanine carboxypeptidase/D-alanyl-D-alanine-endopeptidase [Rhodothermales bacterium]|nr:D-alanyl-D-alanine carboxypeptidase/D-alanyl-D-alanine-endopeptidase [Rhodothermales bacterium]